jgi:hypothetical protein
LQIGLRVLNLSFALQGEDWINFKELKAHWRMHKTKIATSLNVNVKTKNLTSIDFKLFMSCFKLAWELNIDSWRIGGNIPLDKHYGVGAKS